MKTHDRQSSFVVMLFFCLCIIINAAVVTADYNQAPVLMAYLSGDHLAPKPDTGAQGKIEFLLSNDGSELYYKLSVANIKKVTAAHIYMAPKGDTARVVVTLFDLRDIPKRGSFNGTVAEGKITADKLAGPLVGSPLSALLREMEHGYTYVGVNSEAYPMGHIRGQIADPASFSVK